MFSFRPLMNNSVTTDYFFVSKHISSHINIKKLINICVFYLDHILQYFYKYHPYYSSIQ